MSQSYRLNSVFALFEIIFPRTNPMPFLHLIAIVIILLLYLCVAYITYADAHFYVYSFLDDRIHSRGVVAGYIIGILVVSIIAFTVVHFVVRFRQWVTETKLHKTGVLGKQQRQGIADAEMGEVRTK